VRVAEDEPHLRDLCWHGRPMVRAYLQEGRLMLVTGDSPRLVVRDLVAGVRPYDTREAMDQRWILDWIASSAQLFRLAKPATPA
jgi:hypothetical protein